MGSLRQVRRAVPGPGRRLRDGRRLVRQRNVVIEFPSYQAALDCWASEEYQAARALQKGGAEMDLVIIEGYEGPPAGH